MDVPDLSLLSLAEAAKHPRKAIIDFNMAIGVLEARPTGYLTVTLVSCSEIGDMAACLDEG
jgi:hypothetical protein